MLNAVAHELEEGANTGDDFGQVAKVDVAHLRGQRWLSLLCYRIAKGERALVDRVELPEVVLRPRLAPPVDPATCVRATRAVEPRL